MKIWLTIALSLVALAACGPRHEPEQSTTNANAPGIPAPSAPPAVTNSAAPVILPPGTGPDSRTPLAPTVDPKSTEAAEELVRSFVALLNSGKFDDAFMLLGPSAPPRNEFDRDFSSYANLHVTMGRPGDQEGAAGSIYLSVPLTISGAQDGKQASHSANAILRRVNDVPGSTEAQRHWHIEQIDWGNA